MDRDIACDDETFENVERIRHALMNRLTVVVGYAQMLATRPDLDSEIRTRAEHILSQANECVEIIESWRVGRPTPDDPATTKADPARDFGRPPNAPTEPGNGGSVVTPRGRVLVVDDEVIIRTLARNVLSPIHNVETCESAGEALNKIETGEEFDVVLLDLNLDGPAGGQRLYESLQARYPDVAKRVVFISGGAVGPDEVRFLMQSGCHYIQKPFHIEDLRRVIREVMYRTARVSNPHS